MVGKKQSAPEGAAKPERYDKSINIAKQWKRTKRKKGGPKEEAAQQEGKAKPKNMWKCQRCQPP